MGHRRIKDSDRCERCMIKKMWCYCDQLTKLSGRHNVSVVMHYRELFLTSNTAHLIDKTLEKGKVFVRNKESVIENFDELKAISLPTYILFPDEKAIDIESLDPNESINLIVPDGTWTQARKMCKRDSFLKEIKTVSIAPDKKSRYYLRKQGREHGVCTFEAIAYALKHLEGEDTFEGLMKQFELMMTVIHKSRNGISQRDREWVRA